VPTGCGSQPRVALLSAPSEPVLLVVPGPDDELDADALGRTIAALGGEAPGPVLVAGATEAALPAGATASESAPEAGLVALAQPGDEPDPEAIRSAARALIADERGKVFLGAVRCGPDGERLHPPPSPPIGPEVLLAEVRIPPASVLVDAGSGCLEGAFEALRAGATATGLMLLLDSAEAIAGDLVLARVADDPAAGWWSDERGLAELAELAGSELAAERGLAASLRRRLLNLAFNERPVLGRPWHLPDLASDADGPERLREVIDDLIWALERQADSLIALEGGWPRQPIPPSPETGEVIDTELFDRDAEIRRLRETETILREQVAELHERLRDQGEARRRDAAALRRLRADRKAAPARRRSPVPAPEQLRALRQRQGHGSPAIRAWRRLLPVRLRTAVWRLAPDRLEAVRRRTVGEQPDRHDG
jgi:hypothetical protein